MNIKMIVVAAFFVCLLIASSSSTAAESADIDKLVMAKNIDVNAVKNHGEAVMPILASLYTQTDDKLKRAKIAWLFYQLGWKSEAAKNAMMQDAYTDHRDLRLQVQWALGRVSSDDRIVNVLLGTMRDDKSPLFREKAACALASDQIHLSPKQRYELLEGLVQLLTDPKVDVRQNAIQALSIQTGQTKGFNAHSVEVERLKKIQEWKAWLADYRANM